MRSPTSFQCSTVFCVSFVYLYIVRCYPWNIWGIKLYNNVPVLYLSVTCNYLELCTASLSRIRLIKRLYITLKSGHLPRRRALTMTRCRSWQTPSVRWRTERLSGRTDSPLISRSLSTMTPPYHGDCSISSFVYGGGGGRRSSENMPSSWYSTKRKIGQSAATTGVLRW